MLLSFVFSLMVHVAVAVAVTVSVSVTVSVYVVDVYVVDVHVDAWKNSHMYPCFLLPLTSYFSLTLSLCLFTFTRGRGLTLILARFLVRALVDGPNFPPTDMKDHTSVRSPCSRAHFGRVTTACVSSPRDWAVSTGSHMQQGMDISQAPPHLGAPIPLFEFRSRQKTTTQKFGDKNFGDNFPQDMAVLRTLCSACLTPRRRKTSV